ncbi:hypothetical protein [Nostoc sp.]
MIANLCDRLRWAERHRLGHTRELVEYIKDFGEMPFIFNITA